MNVSKFKPGLTAALLLTVNIPAIAEFQPEADNVAQIQTSETIAAFRKNIPRSNQFFDDAYGYAVLPSVTRFGFGFGGAYGRGLVIEQDSVVGKTGFWQFSSGIQAGVKYFSMVVLFKDKEALDYFRERKIQFLGQAGVDVATWGAHGTPAYNDGVAIITMTRLGLMAEFSASGGKWTYKPIAVE